MVKYYAEHRGLENDLIKFLYDSADLFARFEKNKLLIRFIQMTWFNVT